MSEARARKLVAEIVRRMVAAHYPVEMTHKADHRPDYLPVEHFGGWDTNFEENLSLVLINGWHSKAALGKLLQIVRETANDHEDRGYPSHPH